MKNIIEATFDLPKDGNLFFIPSGMRLRGRRDFMRIARHQRDAVSLADEFPRGLPSTFLRLNLDERTATLVEPLRTDEWVPEAETLRAKGIEIPQDVNFSAIHIGDWLHELKRSIDNGYATIVKGALPADLGEESLKEPPTPAEQSAKDIGTLCTLMASLLQRLDKTAGK